MFDLTQPHTLSQTSLHTFITMADIKISPLYYDSNGSLMTYPPPIISKPRRPLSPPIRLSPLLFLPTHSVVLNIQNVRPLPMHPPPTGDFCTIYVNRFLPNYRPHPRLPKDIWHVVVRPAPLLHSGQHVSISGFGIVKLQELRTSSTASWVVYRCADWKTGEKLLVIMVRRIWVERSIWEKVLFFIASIWSSILYYIYSCYSSL